MLKKNGKLEMEQQKQKIQDAYDRNIEELKTKAQSDAEKNISEIERNIQAQNQRLEDEALLQELELEYMHQKTNEFNANNPDL